MRMETADNYDTCSDTLKNNNLTKNGTSDRFRSNINFDVI